MSTCLMLAIAIVFMITLVILVVPLETEHRFYVTIGQDTIIDVAAQTVNVPIISTLFPAPANPSGVYTIEVQIQNVSNPLFLYNVPIGQYTFVLQNVTSGYYYTITTTLIRNNAIVSTFSITTTF